MVDDAENLLRRGLKLVRYAHRLTLGEFAKIANVSEIKLLSFETGGVNRFTDAETATLNDVIRLLLPAGPN